MCSGQCKSIGCKQNENRIVWYRLFILGESVIGQQKGKGALSFENTFFLFFVFRYQILKDPSQNLPIRHPKVCFYECKLQRSPGWFPPKKRNKKQANKKDKQTKKQMPYSVWSHNIWDKWLSIHTYWLTRCCDNFLLFPASNRNLILKSNMIEIHLRIKRVSFYLPLVSTFQWHLQVRLKWFNIFQHLISKNLKKVCEKNCWR